MRATRYTDWGLSLEQVAHYFGVMKRFNADGSIDDLEFDPSGPLSLLWLKRCEETGQFPESEEMRLFDSAIRPGREWFATWEGGWVAVRAEGDNRGAFVWLDEVRA